MKAIKINVEEQKLEYVEVTKDFGISQHIGNGCDMIACPVIFDNEDSIYVDDESLYHEVKGGFIMANWNYPIIGNAIILGADSYGESKDVSTDIEEYKKQIYFVEVEKCLQWRDANV